MRSQRRRTRARRAVELLALIERIDDGSQVGARALPYTDACPPGILALGSIPTATLTSCALACALACAIARHASVGARRLVCSPTATPCKSPATAQSLGEAPVYGDPRTRRPPRGRRTDACVPGGVHTLRGAGNRGGPARLHLPDFSRRMRWKMSRGSAPSMPSPSMANVGVARMPRRCAAPLARWVRASV